MLANESAAEEIDNENRGHDVAAEGKVNARTVDTNNNSVADDSGAILPLGELERANS